MLDFDALRSIAAAMFAVSSALILYTYVGYPLVLAIICRVRRRRRQSPPVQEYLPRITLLIVAHNEEAFVTKRLENALALDYPPEKLEIVLASDGSDDATVGLARCFAGKGVRVLDFIARAGKPAALNAAMETIRSEIVVFSDANTFFEPNAVQRLVRWFGDATVGAVCGRLILVDSLTGQNVDGLYWKYETFLKRCEGQLGALLGANGAIYALRRELYVPLPPGTIVDDFLIPLLVRMRSNCQVVYDADAVAREETPPNIGCEFGRRSRIGCGAAQCLELLWPLLSPRFGWLWFSFVSHKVLRWLCPFFMLAALFANLMLLNSTVFQATFVLQLFAYAMAIVGLWSSGEGKLARIVRLWSMFCAMNLALLVGFVRWFRGKSTSTWQRTHRQIAPSESIP